MVPSVVVSAFAQPLIEGRRILIFGSATGCLWEKALERGARLVHVCDPEPERLAEAAARNSSQLVSFAPLTSQASLAVRDGAFDIGIIENLSVMSDLSSLMRRLRRALSPRGLAFVTAPNPDVQDVLLSQVGVQKQSIDYYTLYDIVRTEFPVVRMLGQMPFVGYTVAELAPVDELEPKLDAGFVLGGTEEPEWFIAAASAQPFELDGFMVVQLPVSEVLHENAARQLREQLRSSRHAERSAVERLARLEAQLSQATVRLAEQRASADSTREIEALKEELRRKEKWIASIEARAAAADMRADEADLQVERLQQQANRGDEMEGRVVQFESELKAALVNAALADRQIADAEVDLTRIEALLKERGEHVRELEAELRSVRRVGEQLVREAQNASRNDSRPFENQSWGGNSPVSAVGQVSSTDTAQSPEQTSAWISQQANMHATESEPEGTTILKALVDDRARLLADFQAATWRVDQLTSAAEKSLTTARRADELESQLAQAEQRLNEQQALLHQLRMHSQRG